MNVNSLPFPSHTFLTFFLSGSLIFYLFFLSIYAYIATVHIYT